MNCEIDFEIELVYNIFKYFTGNLWLKQQD